MDPQLNSHSSTKVSASVPGTDQPQPNSSSKSLTPQEFARNKKEALRRAQERYKKGMDWVKFFREVLGVDGVVASLIPEGSLEAFKTTDEYIQIQQLVARLRAEANPQTEPNKVVTVRMPESLHELLTKEAGRLQTSVNKLCISKLLQLIENDFVPPIHPERGSREGGDSRRADL